jgi:trigger factor
MNISKTPLGKSQIKLKIELTPDEFSQYEIKAVRKLSEQVKIPGFRPGTASFDVVKLHLGKPAITRQAIDLALPECYSKAVMQENLPVVSRPQVDIVSETPLIFEATVALLPEVKVKDHKKIKVDKENTDIADEDVEKVIGNLQRYYATYTPVDRPAQKGDRVEIDFSGTDLTGKPLEGTTSRNHPVVIGENTLIPDFEKNLEGMKVGETKNFAVTFPKDYHAEHFRGKVVNFETTLKKADEPKYHDLTDDFVEKVTGEKKSLATLREEIKKNLTSEKNQQERMRREDRMLEEVLARTEAEIPDMLLDEEVEYIVEDIKADLGEKGITYEAFLKARNKTPEELLKEHKAEAEKRIKIRLALQLLFKEENIDASEAEIEAELSQLSLQYPENEREKAMNEYRKNPQMLMRIRHRVMLRKLFDMMLGAAA